MRMLLIFITILTWQVAFAQDSIIAIPNSSVKILVSTVSKMPVIIDGRDSFIYSIKLKFLNLETLDVNIADLGNFKTGEKIAFYSFSTVLHFKIRDKKLQVTLKEFNKAMDGTEVTIPGYKDFPLQKREEIYTGKDAFEDRLRKVIQKYCYNGLLPPGDSGGDYWITPYFNFYSSGTTTGQISIWISKLAGISPQKYRVTYILRENKTHDPDWRSAGNSVTDGGGKFLVSLLTEINK